MKGLNLKSCFFLLLVSACSPSGQKSVEVSKEALIEGTSERYGGGQCDEKENNECYDYCKDIYKTREARKECEELTVGQVAKIKEAHDFLESPREDELKQIDPDIFDLYLNISIDPLRDLIKDYSRSNAEDLMVWLVKNGDFAEVFQAEDQDYDHLKVLLQQISGSTGTTVEEIAKAFAVTVDGSDTLWDVISKNKSASAEALAWFMGFIQKRNKACSKETLSARCFQLYCIIGRAMNVEDRADLLDIPRFEDYIAQIIDKGVNQPNWARSDIKDTGDLGDWVKELCTSVNR